MRFLLLLLLSLETKKSDRRTKEQSIQNWKENTTPLADVITENDIRDKYRERIIKKMCIYCGNRLQSQQRHTQPFKR